MHFVAQKTASGLITMPYI